MICTRPLPAVALLPAQTLPPSPTARAQTGLPTRRRPYSHRSDRQAHVAALSPTNRAARAAQITANQPLVRYVVGRMHHMADASTLLEFDDLLSYGNEGLIAAVDTFDAARGAQFSTWAVMKIRNAVLDGLRTLDPLPRTIRLRSRLIDRTTSELAHVTGHWPTRAELATTLGEPVAQLEQTLQELARATVESLDRERTSGASGEAIGLALHDQVADDDPAHDPAAVANDRALRRLLIDAVGLLPMREALLITRHYGEGCPLQAIAELLSVSSSRVSQLHARALRRLRERLAIALSDEAPTPAKHVAVLRRAA
jgi:RNA polymerase sigma factor FliA